MTQNIQGMRERKEELNKILWDNFDFEGIEHGNFERPMKAKVQGELEKFVETKISLAISEREREIVNGIDDLIDSMDKENCDEDKSWAFQKKGTSGQVGYQWALQDVKQKIITTILTKPSLVTRG